MACNDASQPTEQTPSRKRNFARRRSSLQFAPEVQVREFALVLGDTPATNGPSLSLGWTVRSESKEELQHCCDDENDLDMTRSERSRRRRLRISPRERAEILLQAGYSSDDLVSNIRQCRLVHSQRRASLDSIKIPHEVLEGAPLRRSMSDDSLLQSSVESSATTPRVRRQRTKPDPPGLQFEAKPALYLSSMERESSELLEDGQPPPEEMEKAAMVDAGSANDCALASSTDHSSTDNITNSTCTIEMEEAGSSIRMEQAEENCDKTDDANPTPPALDANENECDTPASAPPSPHKRRRSRTPSVFRHAKQRFRQFGKTFFLS